MWHLLFIESGNQLWNISIRCWSLFIECNERWTMSCAGVKFQHHSCDSDVSSTYYYISSVSNIIFNYDVYHGFSLSCTNGQVSKESTKLALTRHWGTKIYNKKQIQPVCLLRAKKLFVRNLFQSNIHTKQKLSTNRHSYILFLIRPTNRLWHNGKVLKFCAFHVWSNDFNII